MPPPDTSVTPAFWRCARCGAPNPWAKYLTQCVGCGADRPAKRDAPPTATPPPKPKTSAAAKPETRPRRRLAIASISYLVILLGCLALIRSLGDRWWLATVLLFAPRWAFILPLLVLGIFTWKRGPRRLWIVQAASAFVVVAPLMGFHVPWRRITSSTATGHRIRIMTVNLGLQSVDAASLERAIESQRIDIVCMQEWPENPKLVNRRLDAFFAKGWRRTKNGTIASRFPIIEEYPASNGEYEEYWFWPARLERARVELSPGVSTVVASAHLPTMRNGFWFLSRGDFAAARRYLGWRTTQVVEVLSKLADVGEYPVLLGGDFNTPADSPLAEMVHSNYQSAFDDAGWGFGYSCPSRAPWARIDQIFGSSHWKFVRSWVGPNVGSDHLPVVAEAVLINRSPR
jgi:vancomycin resistance protein VanJ